MTGTGLRLLGPIEGIAAAHWDALVPGAQPFLRHAFLSALERSGSATVETGWQPLHLLLEVGGRPRAAVPLYAKSHSWGEYVFDHGWAEACERAGGRYYPKLLAAVPFTPVPGPRLLTGGDERLAETLVAGLAETCRALDLSSVHVNFCTAEEARQFEAAGWLLRRGIQYHWYNRGYRDFADFLAGLRSSRRKTIRRERREASARGLEIRTLTGDQVTPDLMEAFHPLYLATVDRRRGGAYLTTAFFRLLAERMADSLVVVTARENGRLVAAALNLRDDEALYGRLWGSLESHRFLHFELCYYRALEFAIAGGLARVEAGAQGEHKLLRGYEPVWTWSAHHIRDAGLAAAVARFLRHETRLLGHRFAELESLLPYRRSAQDDSRMASSGRKEK